MHGLSKKRAHHQLLTNDLVGKCRSAHDFYALLSEQCKSLKKALCLISLFSPILPSQIPGPQPGLLQSSLCWEEEAPACLGGETHQCASPVGALGQKPRREPTPGPDFSPVPPGEVADQEEAGS